MALVGNLSGAANLKMNFTKGIVSSKLAQKKMPDGKKEEISQDEYKRGISSWNFDLDDLKSQASLVTECDDSISCKDSDALSIFEMDFQEPATEGPHLSRDFTMKYDIDTEIDVAVNDNSTVSSPEQSVCLSRNASMRGTANGMPINSVVRKDTSMENCDLALQEKDSDTIPSSTSHERKFSFSSCSSDGLASSKESLKQQSSTHNRDKSNGVLLHISGETSPEAVSKAPKLAVPNVEDHDDRARPPLIQQRGRFKVTAGHVELDKSHPPGLQKCHSMQHKDSNHVKHQKLHQALLVAPSTCSYIMSFRQICLLKLVALRLRMASATFHYR